ncbi:MAG: restriction endonuclease [Chloroflexota bacterium]|nr:restriction endonuclease [Chloroflexota bacterium]
MMPVTVPRHNELYNPTLDALHKLGGSGTNQEIHDRVISILELTDQQIQKLHKPGKSNQTEIAYRLAWARTWLKRYGLLENLKWGAWALTSEGQKTTNVDPDEVNRVVNEQLKNEKAQPEDLDETIQDLEENVDSIRWRETLYEVLLGMQPAAFERLCQRMLRKSGFEQVEVTRRSSDGGIDGIGVMRIGGFLSFRVLFQCKRYKDSVGAGTVRDFRGAMIGRTDKGLIVTTGNFTPAAKHEATRDGAPEIDLVDGEQLIDKLKELSLGVETKEVIVEQVTINPDFFANI